MKTLNELMIESDKADWGHNYCVHYEKWFEPLRDEEFTFMEIGIDKGHSLRSWEQYFTKAKIIGIDIESDKLVQSDRITSYCCDQTDEIELTRICNIDSPLVICDDGSHWSEHVIKSFQILFPLLLPGGIYCIEDIECGNRHDFKSKDFKESTIDYVNRMIFNIHPMEYAIYGHKQPQEFSQVESIHVYKNLVVIKKTTYE